MHCLHWRSQWTGWWKRASKKLALLYPSFMVWKGGVCHSSQSVFILGNLPNIFSTFRYDVLSFSFGPNLLLPQGRENGEKNPNTPDFPPTNSIQSNVVTLLCDKITPLCFQNWDFTWEDFILKMSFLSCQHLAS